MRTMDGISIFPAPKTSAQAMDEMAGRAAQLGADAIVGIDIDYEVLGENGGMLMVTASGTAVRLA